MYCLGTVKKIPPYTLLQHILKFKSRFKFVRRKIFVLFYKSIFLFNIFPFNCF